MGAVRAVPIFTIINVWPYHNALSKVNKTQIHNALSLVKNNYSLPVFMMFGKISKALMHNVLSKISIPYT